MRLTPCLDSSIRLQSLSARVIICHAWDNLVIAFVFANHMWVPTSEVGGLKVWQELKYT